MRLTQQKQRKAVQKLRSTMDGVGLTTDGRGKPACAQDSTSARKKDRADMGKQVGWHSRGKGAVRHQGVESQMGLMWEGTESSHHAISEDNEKRP